MSGQDSFQIDIDPKQQILQFLALLRRNWFTIFTFTGAGLLVGIALFNFMPKQYRSDTQLIMRNSWIEEASHVEALKELPVARRSKLLGDQLGSTTWVEDVLDRMEWPEWVQARDRGEAARQAFVTRVKDQLDAQVLPGEGGEKIITISFRWSDRIQARDFTKEMRNYWLASVEDQYKDEVAQMVEISETILQEKRDRLRRLMGDKESFERANDVFLARLEQGVDFAREVQLVGEADAMGYEMVKLQGEIDFIDRQLSEVDKDGNLRIPPVVLQLNETENSEFNATIEQVRSIMAEIEDLLAKTYTEKHHMVKSAYGRLEAALAVANEQGGSGLSTLETETVPNEEYLEQKRIRDGLQRQLSGLEDKLGRIRRELETVEQRNDYLPGILQKLQDLRHQIETQQLVVSTHVADMYPLLDRAKALDIRGSGGELMNYTVLEEPAVATNAESPLGWLALAMSVFAGFGIAAAMIGGRELLKTSFTTADQASRTLKLPVLGEAAPIQTEIEARRARLQRTLQVAASLTLLAGLGAVIYVCLAHPELLPVGLRQWAAQLRDGLV